MHVSCAFVCLSCMHYFLSFSLSLGFGGWLQNVIVALPGCFISFFETACPFSKALLVELYVNVHVLHI